jgi:EmrB/QacA subfamily drug resistance transporter
MTVAKNMRWIALFVLCLGDLMIVLDATIVNVALPFIHTDLGFTESSLAWVVNGYLLTFGGFLLLGGRLGDLFGHKRLFLIGLMLFTFASLLCGMARTQEFLIAARALQGVGGAVLSAVALSLTMMLFTEDSERAKAMGIFGFVSAGGGSIGVLLGGLLVGTLNWHWIFFINIPVGIIVFLLSLWVLPKGHTIPESRQVDIAGAVLVTSSLMLAVYAIVGGNEVGWLTPQTLGLLAASALLMVAFIYIESKVKAPLMKLSLFKNKTIVYSNIIAVLWAAAMFAFFFISSLYLQLVLKLSPMMLGLTFLPSNLIMAVFSLWLSAKIVMKFGIRLPAVVGLGLAAAGLLLFVFAPVDGSILIHVLPSMILLGVGAGIAFNPLLLAAMGEVPEDESGLASGLVNTSFMMGGALGLAILASVGAAYTAHAIAQGTEAILALNNGYHVAFLIGGLGATLAALLSFKLPIRTRGSHFGH